MIKSRSFHGSPTPNRKSAEIFFIFQFFNSKKIIESILNFEWQNISSSKSQRKLNWINFSVQNYLYKLVVALFSCMGFSDPGGVERSCHPQLGKSGWQRIQTSHGRTRTTHFIQRTAKWYMQGAVLWENCPAWKEVGFSVDDYWQFIQLWRISAKMTVGLQNTGIYLETTGLSYKYIKICKEILASNNAFAILEFQYIFEKLPWSTRSYSA